MTDTNPIDALERAVQAAGTQTRFAEAHGFPQSYISAVMRGERPASDKLLTCLGLRRAIVPVGDAK